MRTIAAELLATRQSFTLTDTLDYSLGFSNKMADKMRADEFDLLALKLLQMFVALRCHYFFSLEILVKMDEE